MARPLWQPKEEKNMANITAWDRVMLARKMNRPRALDYINELFDDFMELLDQKIHEATDMLIERFEWIC